MAALLKMMGPYIPAFLLVYSLSRTGEIVYNLLAEPGVDAAKSLGGWIAVVIILLGFFVQELVKDARPGGL